MIKQKIKRDSTERWVSEDISLPLTRGYKRVKKVCAHPKKGIITVPKRWVGKYVTIYVVPINEDISDFEDEFVPIISEEGKEILKEELGLHSDDDEENYTEDHQDEYQKEYEGDEESS